MSFLGDNNIQAAGAASIAASLPYTQVYTLDLCRNAIGVEGACVLAKALPSTQVRSLLLGSNNIGAEGVVTLASALPGTQVQALYLGFNNIGDEGFAALAASLRKSSVDTLLLERNQISEVGEGTIRDLTNSRLKLLDLTDNPISREGEEALKKVPHEIIIKTAKSPAWLMDQQLIKIRQSLVAEK